MTPTEEDTEMTKPTQIHADRKTIATQLIKSLPDATTQLAITTLTASIMTMQTNRKTLQDSQTKRDKSMQQELLTVRFEAISNN